MKLNIKGHQALQKISLNQVNLSLISGEWLCVGPHCVNLQAWHDQVDAVDTESHEEGYALCTEKVKQSAKQILTQVAKRYGGQGLSFDIYPTEEQEIHIWCRPRVGYGLLIRCEPNAQVGCFLTAGEENKDHFFESVDKVNYDFLWSMFEKMGVQVCEVVSAAMLPSIRVDQLYTYEAENSSNDFSSLRSGEGQFADQSTYRRAA